MIVLTNRRCNVGDVNAQECKNEIKVLTQRVVSGWRPFLNAFTVGIGGNKDRLEH